MKRPFPLISDYSVRDAKAVGFSRSVNWYPEKAVIGGKQTWILKQRPGLKLETTIGTGGIRGAIVHQGVAYVVSNNKFYSYTTGSAVTERGTLSTFNGFVSLASNGTQVIIVDGIDGWIWNSNTSVFAQITDVDFVDAIYVTFINGRFVVPKPSTGQFYISALYDGLTWSSVDFATAEIDPDNLVTLETDHQQLWFFGEITTEIFVGGSGSFPFDRQPGGFIEWGIAAPRSLAKGDNTLIWLAKNKSGQGHVVKARGYHPDVISNDALEERISDYTDITDAFGYVVKAKDKHLFYVLTFPTGNETFVYDFATNIWHQWATYNATNTPGDRFQGNVHFLFNNKNLIGDRTTGKIFSMDADTYKDDGVTMVREAVPPNYHDNYERIFYDEIEARFDVRGHPVSGQGSSPLASLSIARDGGNVFGNSRTTSIGKVGEYKNRARWLRNGSAYQCTPKITVSDPVDATLYGLYFRGRKSG